MRRSILIALAILGIFPVAASAATKSSPVSGMWLVVTATQDNGQSYPLQSGQLTYLLRVKIGKQWHHRWAENAPNGVPKWIKLKARVGDTIIVCRWDGASQGFGPGNTQCLPAYVFVKDDARKGHVFNFPVTWTGVSPQTDILPSPGP